MTHSHKAYSTSFSGFGRNDKVTSFFPASTIVHTKTTLKEHLHSVRSRLHLVATEAFNSNSASNMEFSINLSIIDTQTDTIKIFTFKRSLLHIIQHYADNKNKRI